MMDEKTLRVLIEAGSVKQMRIIGDGARFHVDVVTVNKGSITATTAKGDVNVIPLKTQDRNITSSQIRWPALTFRHLQKLGIKSGTTLPL